jgi:hypothetical protein
VKIQVDAKEEGSRSDKESDRGSDIVSSPPRLVASIDSIAANANFVSFE